MEYDVYENNNFYNYLKKIRNNYITFNPRFKLILLDKNENPIRSIKDEDMIIGSGNLHKDNKSGSSRTLGLSLLNTNKEYNYNKYKSFFEWKQKYSFYIGIELSGDIYWFPQGIFVLKTISEQKDQITLNFADKYCLLDGSMDGVLNMRYKILADETTVKSLVKDLINSSKEYNQDYDPKDIIIDDFLAKEKFPYEMTKEAGTKISDILSEIAKVFGLIIYYDQNGRLNIKAENSNTKYKSNLPISWKFNIEDCNLISNTTNFDYGKIYNKVKVIGNTNGQYGVIEATAENKNPYSSFKIDTNNKFRQCTITDTKIQSIILAKQRAEVELEKLINFELSNKLSTTFIPHLEPNMLVEIQTDNKEEYDIEVKKYLINSVDIPLSYNSTFSLTVTNTEYLPMYV